MAAGQRFHLDLDADNWQFDIKDDESLPPPIDAVSEIKERDSAAIPAAPTLKSSKTGFPEHRTRPVSAFKQRQQAQKDAQANLKRSEPSDKAILHHAAKKHGVDLESTKHESQIDAENRNRINNMSLEEIEEAREEVMAQFNFKDPNFLRKFLQRADIDTENDKQQKEWDEHEAGRPKADSHKTVSFASQPAVNEETTQSHEESEPSQPQNEHEPSISTSTVHFPAPPRNPADYKPLDPNDPNFLKDLHDTYFPDLPYDPSKLTWLTDPTPTEEESSPYNPDKAGYVPSSLRFSFVGTLITPSDSLDIPTTAGLHHHGDAPSSAGYTIPELALLERSTLPNQRCIAYQVLGRILYRLGRGDFGPRGGELSDGLWNVVEKERVIEVMMSEANRGRGHLSARNYATEALWLWRRGGGGDRGVLKEGERRAI